MDASYRLILLLMLCSFNNLVSGQDYEDPEGLDPRVSRFYENARSERSLKKPDPVKDIDLTYPGCGFRSPKIPGTSGGGRSGLSSHNCKTQTSDFFPMIVGGNLAKHNSWPWMVAVRRKTHGQIWNHLCGASLISQKFVLTAAHCFVADIDPSKYSIVVGAHTRSDGTEYPVSQILIHPGYKKPITYNDIAIIVVGRPVVLSKKVYPVCLPSDGLKNEIQTDNLIATVTGWGQTSYGGISSEELQEVTIQIFSFKECKAYLGISNLRPLGIIKQQMCAGVLKGGKDACAGDSGGPLVSKLQDNSYVQLGVVSSGIGCAFPGYPGIYTRVSEYTKWIYDNTDLGK